MVNPQLEVILSVLSYSLCSASLVLLNKVTLWHMPYPSLVVSIQLVFSILFIYTVKHFKVLQVDELQWEYVVPYLYYIVLFSLGVLCNMKSLNIS
jgi:hypothetical protein